MALEQDVPCAGCDYNLRGLSSTGLCPECGGSIQASIEEMKRGVTVAELRAARRVCICSLLACGGAVTVGLTAFSRPWIVAGIPIVGEMIAWTASLLALNFARPLLQRTALGRRCFVFGFVIAIAALSVVVLRLLLMHFVAIGVAGATIATLVTASNVLAAPVPLLAVIDVLRRERAPGWLAAATFGIVFVTALADVSCEFLIFSEIQRMPPGMFALTTPHPAMGYGVIWPIAIAGVVSGRPVAPVGYGIMFGVMLTHAAWVVAVILMSVTLTGRIRRRAMIGQGS